MRIADYIAQELSKVSNTCYMVTGGGAMHLNDAFSKSDLNIVYCHHEQACAIAAEAEARINKIPAIVNVTTGPGGINALNGVFGAFTDSIPMIVISGQVKRETLVRTYDIPWRQLGDQEVDIVRMAEGITKYCVCITDPMSIRFHLEKSVYLASTGRPGPVWIDIPIDIQSMNLNIDELEGFTESNISIFDQNKVLLQLESVINCICKSKRPVFYIGSGIHVGNCINELMQLLDVCKIPVVTAWNSNDLIPDDHPLYVGRGGTIGNRSGNFVLHSSDLVIVLGSRLNIRLVSYNWNSFSPKSYKIGIDIDELEMNKPTCKYDMKIHSSLQFFIPKLLELMKVQKKALPDFKEWLDWGKERLIKYPVCLAEYWKNVNAVNPYCFVDSLFENLDHGEIVVCADGTACVVTFQAMKIKPNQRVFHNSGCASMGYELPASIGAYYARSNSGRIICIAGDGSIMMNLQELQTISGNNLPIQIYIMNNQGYHSIRQTQKSFFSNNIVGCGIDSGLTFPSFEKIAYAFDFEYHNIKNHSELMEKIPELTKKTERFICEVHLDLDQHFSPKLASKKLEDGSMMTSSLHDMSPFLNEEEMLQNIIN